MIQAEQQGRDLVLTMEGLDPFVIKPLPGRAGVQVTDTYINGTSGAVRAEEMAAAMIMCVDGAVFDEDTDRWVPVPLEERHNYTRIELEMRQAEAELILMPAFFWQSTLGIDGVKAYVGEGGGLAGTLKATGALFRRLAIFERKTSPNSGSVAPTNTGSTPSTSSLADGVKPGRPPLDRLPKKRRWRKG